MLINLHKKLQRKKFNFYDYTVGFCIGIGMATSSLVPLIPISVLLLLSVYGGSNDTSN